MRNFYMKHRTLKRKRFKKGDYYRDRTSSTDLKTKKEEKWLSHYSSYGKILLVGEGDFSFSCSLADAFASAHNMVATSLDSKEELLAKYSTAAKNLAKLESYGCTIIHEVNAHTMSDHPLLFSESFDFIIFNFAHAGFIHGAFSTTNPAASRTCETTYPFDCWNLVELAVEVGFGLVSMRPFFRWEFTGYINKKGSGLHCNRTFPVGDASTYMFKKLESNFT